jgi:hypothetical protein
MLSSGRTWTTLFATGTSNHDTATLVGDGSTRPAWGGQYIFDGKQSRAGASLQPTIHSGSRRPELNSAVACTPIAHVVALLRRETKRRVVLPRVRGQLETGVVGAGIDGMRGDGARDVHGCCVDVHWMGRLGR